MTFEGVPGQEKVIPAKAAPAISPGDQKMPGEGSRSFSSFMEGSQPNPLLETKASPQISPFDLAQGSVPPAGANFHTIQEQAKTVHTTLGDISNQLNTPKLKLKQSTKYLLKNKLTGAQGNIKSASSKLGAPQIAETEVSSSASPLTRYISMVTDGQNQLEAVQHHLASIASTGKELRPADMLLVQIKMNKAQQQLEYSSMLLGKASDDLKMLMNIQL